jgi:hypothetical protein
MRARYSWEKRGMDHPQCFHATVKGLVLDERGAVLLLPVFELGGMRRL